MNDKSGSYWYDRSSQSLELIPDLPRISGAALEGDTVLFYTVAPSQAYLWKPGNPPIALANPDNLYGIAGVSLSPDERYAAVVYDRDIPNGPRVCKVRIYDTLTGETMKWPFDAEKLAGSYYIGLLGWSNDNTIRLIQGSHGTFGGLTWVLPTGNPESDHEGFSMMGSEPVTFGDGKWVLYGSIPERIVVQSVAKDSKPPDAISTKGRSIECHAMMNGNLAISVFDGSRSWFELKADGTLRPWDGIGGLY